MDRSRHLNVKDRPFSGKAVIYIMSRDQRVRDNHALLDAQTLAIEHKVPLYVLFVLKKTGIRSREHYEFMLAGLAEVSKSLNDLGISFVMRTGNPEMVICDFAKEVNSGALFFDFNPLLGSRNLIKNVAKKLDISVSVVDTHNVVPVWVASSKQEFAAHTMRTKIHKNLEKYLLLPPSLKKHPIKAAAIKSLSLDDAKKFIESIPASGINIGFKPGEAAAIKHLKQFIDTGLNSYAVGRNNISEDKQSGLSPYLHFGTISSLRVAVEVVNSVQEIPLLLQRAKLAESGETPSLLDGMNALLEEMIVRKELSDNFCLYSEGYMSLVSAPEWAQKSLAEHVLDKREFTYTLEQWESGATHNVAWNAAQIELIKSGKIHGYMRMYWAKKILEWTSSPDEALKVAIFLNDKYSIDGGDPNGYVGILWSIAGLHDRPWFERPVYGKVRYMNEAGLRRKFDVDAYIKRVNEL